MVYDTVDVSGVAVVANVSDSVMNVGGPGGPMLANHAATCYGDGFQSKSNVSSLLPFLFFCMFVHVMFHVLVFVVKITWKHVVCDVKSFLVECVSAVYMHTAVRGLDGQVRGFTCMTRVDFAGFVHAMSSSCSCSFQFGSAILRTIFPAFFGNFRSKCSRSHSIPKNFQPVVNLCVLLIFCMLMRNTEAVCLHCKDTIVGCKGGDQCPTVIDLAANVAVFAAGTLGKVPNVQNLLPNFLRAVFTRAVCEAIVGIATQPLSGTTIDFSATAYAAAGAVVQAAHYGHCTWPEAIMELSSRLDAATETIAVSKLTAAIDLMKSKESGTFDHCQGVFTFIWAKISVYVSSRNAGTARLTSGSPSSKSGSGEFLATLKRPSTQHEFYEMLHWFIYCVHVFGLVSISLLHPFIADVVYNTIGALRETWQVAHELLMVYLAEIENDALRVLHFGNVFRRGGQDSFLQMARANAAAFFRTRGENPRLGNGQGKGKFDDKSKKPCIAYNKGLVCDHLADDSSCKFNHRCMQWVSDKGPRGMCWAEHAKCNGCNYDGSKKLDSPAH